MYYLIIHVSTCIYLKQARAARQEAVEGEERALTLFAESERIREQMINEIKNERMEMKEERERRMAAWERERELERTREGGVRGEELRMAREEEGRVLDKEPEGKKERVGEREREVERKKLRVGEKEREGEREREREIESRRHAKSIEEKEGIRERERAKERETERKHQEARESFYEAQIHSLRGQLHNCQRLQLATAATREEERAEAREEARKDERKKEREGDREEERSMEARRETSGTSKFAQELRGNGIHCSASKSEAACTEQDCRALWRGLCALSLDLTLVVVEYAESTALLTTELSERETAMTKYTHSAKRKARLICKFESLCVC